MLYRMNSKTLILLFFLSLQLYCTALFAQGENNVWAFGIHAGIDFNSGKPEFFISNSNTNEGCATICNSIGELLFYSDGLTVRDRTHAVMPNGNDILGNHGAWTTRGSATQGVAIIPDIINTNKYYVFTVDCNEAISPPYTLGYLRYSIVDMSLNGGLGDVITKNVILDSGTSEKMIVTKGSECFYWLLVRKHSSNQFKAFKVSAEGLNTNGIVSMASSFSNHDISGQRKIYMGGEMKISPNQKLVALTTGGRGTFNGVEICDFDNNTGIVSNARIIYNSASHAIYGLDFAPGSQLFYIAATSGFAPVKMNLLQLNIALLPDVNAVISSTKLITPEGIFGGMRRGPDGKLYITGYNTKTLYCINNPDKTGDSCNLTTLELNIPDTIHTQIGFGSHIYSLNDLIKSPTYINTDTFLCDQQELTITAPDGFDSYLWHDGFTGQSRNISGKNIWVKSSNACSIQVDTFNISNCNDCLWIPNAFSPNRDGINDQFRPVGKHIEHFEMYIYNRWGNLVFSANTPQSAWNGMYGADLCDVGSYFYHIKARCKSGRDFTLKGDITLLR